MRCTLRAHNSGQSYETVVCESVKAARIAFGELIDDLARYGGVFYTAWSNGEECNIGAWFWWGDVIDDSGDTPDYPDEVWSADWSERNQEWRIKREKA